MVECVYGFLEGHPLSDPLSQGVHFGQEIGRLCAALHDVQCPHIPSRNLYDTVYGGVMQIIVGSEDEEIGKVGSLLQALKPEMGVMRDLPSQMIHRDAHPGNMIFDYDRFMGFIDFDIVENNIRLFDPCYCAASALPTGFGQQGFAERWLAFLREIVWGFDSVSPLSFIERQAIGHVVIGIEALFTALFVRTDREIARKNASICLWLAGLLEEINRQR